MYSGRVVQDTYREGGREIGQTRGSGGVMSDWSAQARQNGSLLGPTKVGSTYTGVCGMGVFWPESFFTGSKTAVSE